jgi:DegT/DnrJ/EryC1/StrS aminotransferase family
LSLEIAGEADVVSGSRQIGLRAGDRFRPETSKILGIHGGCQGPGLLARQVFTLHRWVNRMTTASSIVPFAPPTLGPEEIAEVVATLESGWLTSGPRVASFERRFANYVGAPHALSVNSCTAALHLSLLASGVEAGDEVITTPLTFCATANAIVHAGGTPVLRISIRCRATSTRAQ